MSGRLSDTPGTVADPVAETEQALDRIARLDPDLHAFVRVTADAARERARGLRDGTAPGAGGPLHGVPFGIKDNIDVAGVATSNGIAARDGHVPERDATLVARLRDAGAVSLGKLAMAEGALAQPRADLPPAVNPWDPRRWPAASSTGAGIAVATGMCAAAVGTDTGGSARLPAAVCGVVGLKPTWGRIPRTGVVEYAAALDTVGPITRTVADAAVVLGVLAGFDPRDPTSSSRPVPDHRAGPDGDLTGVRIGIDPSFNLAGRHRATDEATSRVLAALGARGAGTAPVDLDGIAQASQDWFATSAVEMCAVHEEAFPGAWETYGEGLRTAVEIGRGASAVDHVRLVNRRLVYTEVVERALQTADLLLTPVFADGCPTLEAVAAMGHEEGDVGLLSRFTAPFNMTGHPALVFPAGADDGGVPIAVQLVGRRFEEPLLLRAGHAFQAATTWHERRPSLSWAR